MLRYLWVLVCLIATVVLMSLFDGGEVFSHSGRTDSSGGHNNRKTGEYHYHNSGRARSSTTSRAAVPLKKETAKIEKEAETENAELVQEVQNLKEQVKALADANERLNLQMEDLYLMTQSLRVKILGQSGYFYYGYIGDGWYRMLPSEDPMAELRSTLRDANELGISKEKQNELGEKLLEMSTNRHVKNYSPVGDIHHKDKLIYNHNTKSYQLSDEYYRMMNNLRKGKKGKK